MSERQSAPEQLAAGKSQGGAGATYKVPRGPCTHPHGARENVRAKIQTQDHQRMEVQKTPNKEQEVSVLSLSHLIQRVTEASWYETCFRVQTLGG